MEEKPINWYVFQIWGIQIEEQENWQDFIFGDATLVKASQFKSHIKELKVESYFAHLEYFSDDQTLLIVRRGSKLEDNLQKVTDSAEKRALEVTSFIFFVFLYLTDFSVGITMHHHIYEVKQKSHNIFTNYGLLSDASRTDHKPILSPARNSFYIYTRENLVQLFQSELFRNIFAIIVKPSKDHHPVLIALTNFYQTANIPFANTQLLGAITSIEILLKEQADKYDELSERTNVLLRKISEKFQDVGKLREIRVYKLRHKIIHEGEVYHGDDAHEAIILFSYILIIISTLLDKFSNKFSLYQHLDLIVAVNKMNGDRFNILPQWGQMHPNIDILDPTIRYIMAFYHLCDKPAIPPPAIDYAKAIYWYASLKTVTPQTSFKLFQQHHYYHPITFTTFEELDEYYQKNQLVINPEIEKWVTHPRLKYIRDGLK